jgi:stearoyl-CoA desaturase (delta-9 desaturase)
LINQAGKLSDVNEPKQLPLDWRNIGLLTLVHVAAIGGLALYLSFHGLTAAAAVIGFVLTALTIFSISAGYHRLFSHRAYEAHPALRIFLLFFGAGAFQNSALAWAADHRRHHGRTDTDLDPYNARRGFWYSHIGWVLRKADPEIVPASVRDLERDPFVRFQSRHYAWVGVAAGLVLPTLLGLAFGDPLGGFVIGAAVRLLVTFHTTFAINSFAHYFGRQPYSDRTSARDSFVVALVSMGEGYHNFHHTFPADYRNGVRAHQFDPTKWVLRVLALLGVARNLRRTPVTAILKATLRMDEDRLAQIKVSSTARERIENLREAIHALAERFAISLSACEQARIDAGRQALRTLRAELRAVQAELREAQAAWRRLLRSPELAM